MRGDIQRELARLDGFSFFLTITYICFLFVRKQIRIFIGRSFHSFRLKRTLALVVVGSILFAGLACAISPGDSDAIRTSFALSLTVGMISLAT